MLKWLLQLTIFLTFRRLIGPFSMKATAVVLILETYMGIEALTWKHHGIGGVLASFPVLSSQTNCESRLVLLRVILLN